MSDHGFAGLGTQGSWRVEVEPEQPPRVVACRLGRWQDEKRTVATMKDNSILSHEDAELIARTVNELRAGHSHRETETL